MASKSNHIERLKEQVKRLPGKPGVYQYFDENGVIIYVGKAKNLKKRVASYFSKKHDSTKTKILVRKIREIKHIVVETEQDALLLENNLIKKYMPRYNVMLKDDKTYPWICIKKEPFPRVFKTRNFVRDGSQYFGPYASVYMINTILELVKHLYKLRSCKLNLSASNVAENKYKVCLEYHLGNCLGPCLGLQSMNDYDANITHIKSILKGHLNGVKSYLKEMMMQMAAELNFEGAEETKQKIELIEKYQSKSTVVSASITNIDVVSIRDDEKLAFVNFLKIIDGQVIQAHTMEMTKRLDEDKTELLSLAIVEMRERFSSDVKEIIVPFEPDVKLNGVTYTVPQRGDKVKLLELSERNVKYYRLEKMKQAQQLDKGQQNTRVLQTLKDDLKLDYLPVHIECFDNSNLQGTNAVAACVVFKGGKPAKRDYRHFNIKTVEGPDDFASMTEVVHRRYKRLLDEGESIPQLIVIDGGKGQLGAAMEALSSLKFEKEPKVIGIAKRLEEIYRPGDPVPLYLDKNSESLKIIQRLRDEAHRFGITHHRNKRSKELINNELSQIDGIGEKTAEILLKSQKSVKQIKTLTLSELEGVVGKHKAKIVFDYFKKDKNGNSGAAKKSG